MELDNKFTQIIFAVNVLIALTSLVSLRELPDPMDRCGLVDRESCKNFLQQLHRARVLWQENRPVN